MRVAIVTESDFAGSGYFASSAMNQTDMSCRHVALTAHPWKLPYDCIGSNDLIGARDILNNADLIHLWNILPDNHAVSLLGCPKEKIKSITLTGSLYRNESERCNAMIRKHGLQFVIQNPCFAELSEELEPVFIQHSLPIEMPPVVYERSDLVAVYDKHRGSGKPSTTTNGHADAMAVNLMIRDHFPGWQIELKGPPIPWLQRMQRLSASKFAFEYFDHRVGYWGRSTLEACAYGVVPLTWWRPECVTEIDEPPFPRVTEDNFMDALKLAIEDWDLLSSQCRQWVHLNYSPEIVGQKYKTFFEGIS